MRALDEDEFAAAFGVRSGRDHRPAGQHIGKARHVVLRVAAVDTERVQLEDLARQVLVQALGLVDAAGRIRSDRLRVVEVEQHRRMALGGKQHVAEAAERMGADRLTLITAGHGLNLVRRDTEMVRPEPDQPLGKADLGCDGGLDACRRFLQEQLLRQRGLGWPRRLCGLGRWRRRRSRRCGRRSGGLGRLLRPGRACHLLLVFAFAALDLLLRVALLVELEHQARGFRAARQALVGDAPGIGAIEFCEQRAAWIGRDRGDRPGARAETEAMQCERSLNSWIERHARRPKAQLSRYLATAAQLRLLH